MNYREAIEFLTELTKFGFNFGLDRIMSLLNMLGNPHENLRIVHIGGTNGKGSTSAMVAKIMTMAGYKVGMFSSPHVHSYNERMKINGNDISEERVARILTRMRPLLEEMVARGEEHPTEFEVNTAMAFTYFHEEQVDMVVLEVGLGGAIDSTNVVANPLITVITNVGMDHMDYLGHSLGEIASVKAGIVKDGVPLVTASDKPEVLEILSKECARHNAPLHRVGVEWRWHSVLADETGVVFDLETPRGRYGGLKLSLLGEHQVQNAATAVAVAELLAQQGFNWTEENLRQGLATTIWPARLERVRLKPKVILDAAHNVDGASTLARALAEIFDYQKLILVIGMLADKERKKVLSILAPIASVVIVTKPNSPRSGDWEQMASEATAYTTEVLLEEEIRDAVEKAILLAGEEDMVCITGSFYMVAEARKYLVHSSY